MMRPASLLLGSALLVVSSSSTAGEAEPPPEIAAPRGPQVALRVGAAAPVGEAIARTGALADTIALDVPAALEIGWRFSGGRLHVGAYGQLGVLVARACSGEDARCTGDDLRAGGFVAYRFDPGALVDPWLGLGMSYERLDVSRRADRRSVDLTASGLSFLDVHAGAAVAVTPALRVGPYLSASIGRFTAVEIDGEKRTDFDPGYHAWISFGLRAELAP